jgi:hypothetical protein
MARSPFGAGGLDFGQNFRIGQRRFGQSSQAIGGVEQLAHPAASNLVAQQALQALRLQQTVGLCLAGYLLRQSHG